MNSLSKLVLENWRNHPKTSLDLDHVNVFAGGRGSGKSSILAAMQFLLTGRTEWAEGGQGLDTHIRDGAKKAKVTGVLEGAEFERCIPTKGKPEIPWSPDLIAACLRSRRILDMFAKEQQDLIFSVLHPEADFDEIVKAINQ